MCDVIMTGERERLATERLQAANARAASSAAACEAVRSEITALTEDLEKASAARRDADAALRRAEVAASQV